jgi:hypothetical protein
MYRFLGKSPPASLILPLPKTTEPINLSNNQKDASSGTVVKNHKQHKKNVKDEQSQPSNQEATK